MGFSLSAVVEFLALSSEVGHPKRTMDPSPRVHTERTFVGTIDPTNGIETHLRQSVAWIRIFRLRQNPLEALALAIEPRQKPNRNDP